MECHVSFFSHSEFRSPHFASRSFVLLAGQIYDRCKIRLIDVPEPQLERRPTADGDGDILFQPELACLCGSDLTFFQHDYPEFKPAVGQSLHEMIGTVVDTNGHRFRPGDRVLCVPVDHFGLWQRYRVSERRAIPLDPRPSDEQAVMAQPLGTVLYALRKLPNLLDWNVVVVGQGPIGQLFNGALRNLGARQILAIESLADRRAVSARTGATAVIDPAVQDPIEAVRDLTDGAMADLVVEAVGHREQVLNLCVDLCRPQGTILFFGVPPRTIDNVRLLDLFMKNQRLVTSVGPDFTRDFPLAMRWIAEGRIDVLPIITHRFPLAEIQTAFDTYFERRDGALKVFVDFTADGH
jgi:threonine dehydrogenase-like Zn-dependent dehydrogenase